jgi:glycosyltransferase involved in cell wall biosynthesis
VTQPLVSILISAYNAEKLIGFTLNSAINQTWPRKEIILVDDGSKDRTAEIAERFASKGVRLIRTENRGLSAGQNTAFQHSRGDYIQYLDADDLLAPEKIERQLSALRTSDSKRVLLSCPWAYFYYRTQKAKCVKNSLWRDLSPAEWLMRKMREGIHMQNATWLVSRELAETAGPWNESLHYDQDGEFFTRVLIASEGTRFVPNTVIFYRATGTSSISYIGNSDLKKESLWTSMKFHIWALRSLEDNERVRRACIAYIQNWFQFFYPDRPDLVSEMRAVVSELGGQLKEPRLRWKYAWLKPLFGWKAAKWAQMTVPQMKASAMRYLDKAVYQFDARDNSPSAPTSAGCFRSVSETNAYKPDSGRNG